MIDRDPAIALEDLEASIAEALNRLAQQTGAARYRHLARQLIGERQGGRPPVDDSNALAEVQRLVARRQTAGRPIAERAACGLVARRLVAPEHVRAMTRRLLRKLKK
jgi:hypothetical protein